MNIMEKLLPWTHAGDDVEGAEPREAKRTERTHGPVKMRSMSNGQIRRAIQRQQATAQRKKAKAFRRRWMDNRQNVAVLRGQLATLAEGASPACAAIERVLVERFGSVEAAQEQYDGIVAEASA